jgi:hypothetical protein
MQRPRTDSAKEETTMIESIDVRLREIGISDTNVQNRLDGKDKALVVTDQDVVYIDSNGLQRSTLRFVTKVITDKTGSLTIRSSSGPAIEGSIRGFDVTELKVFFEGVKASIARAKTASNAAQGAPQSQQEPDAHEPAPLSSAAHLDHSAHPEHAAHSERSAPPEMDAFPSMVSSPAPAMDPWESLSTARPTLEMPAAPGALSGFADDFETSRSGLGALSSDSLDWDEHVHDTSVSRPVQTAALDAFHEEPMLEPDELSLPAPADGDAKGALGVSSSVPALRSTDALNQPSSPAAATTPTLADHYAISPASRWLKILAIPLGLIGIAASALSVPATDNTSPLQWLQVAGLFIGGISAGWIAYGIGDLLAIWGSMASDIQTIRRSQNR